jgi:hypothetical protein
VFRLIKIVSGIGFETARPYSTRAEAEQDGEAWIFEQRLYRLIEDSELEIAFVIEEVEDSFIDLNRDRPASPDDDEEI